MKRYCASEQAESDTAKAQAAKAQAARLMQPQRHAMTLRMHRLQPRRPNPTWQPARLLPQPRSRQPRQMRTNPRADTLTAQQAAQQAETDKAAMRAKLSEQLNSILQTRDSARGLIVSMSDVLFDTGKYSLKPGAREKLAKVAGILLAYPGLNIEVGGYTDNVGGDAMNQTLSENRAGSVRDYLVQQGVSTNSVSSKGFGNTLPVASNDNSAGRQQNRRVELLVSGEAIGNPVNATTGSLR